MNNRFFVLVLALGIAALGAAASPSPAATDSLTITTLIGPPPDNKVTYLWQDSVSLTDSGSVWTKATEYQGQDGATASPVYSVGESFQGPGNFYAQWTAQLPASGHSSRTVIKNEGTYPPGSPNTTWTILTNSYSLVTDSSGTTQFNGS